MLWAATGLILGTIFICAGYWLGVQFGHQELVSEWKHDIQQQQGEMEAMRRQSEANIEALTQKIAFFQAHINRLDALGNKLLSMADMDDLEIDFTQAPGIGSSGMDDQINQDILASLEDTLGNIASELQSQENKLHTLDVLLTDQNFRKEVYPQGRPVEKGWISSYYGKRNDPFSGKPSFHHGIDFAGKEGSNVVAVASGVVTYTGSKSGYGEMVEISHGDGFVTRYSHNRENLVKPGDVVRKGQAIALMGSTGRSTGAHVHYEVYKHGRSVDPSSYVRRTRR